MGSLSEYNDSQIKPMQVGIYNYFQSSFLKCLKILWTFRYIQPEEETPEYCNIFTRMSDHSRSLWCSKYGVSNVCCCHGKFALIRKIGPFNWRNFPVPEQRRRQSVQYVQSHGLFLLCIQIWMARKLRVNQRNTRCTVSCSTMRRDRTRQNGSMVAQYTLLCQCINISSSNCYLLKYYLEITHLSVDNRGHKYNRVFMDEWHSALLLTGDDRMARVPARFDGSDMNTVVRFYLAFIYLFSLENIKHLLIERITNMLYLAHCSVPCQVLQSFLSIRHGPCQPGLVPAHCPR